MPYNLLGGYWSAGNALTPEPQGLGRTPHDLAAIVKEHRDPQVLAQNAEPLKSVEEAARENGRLGGKGNRNQDRQSTPVKRDSDYLTARIARDRPDILEDMKRGKYTSVRSAAKAAGIVKEAPPLAV
jgi:hypothetical protein